MSSEAPPKLTVSDSLSGVRLSLPNVSELARFTPDNTQFTQPYLREFYSYVEPDEVIAINWRVGRMLHIVGFQDAALVFGAGPTMHDALVIAPHVDEIHLSDYLDRNLQVLEEWVTKRDGHWNWNPFTSYILELETGQTPTQEQIEERESLTRRKIRQILFCDATQERPLGHFAHYPLVTNMFVADSATDNPQTYVEWMHNIASLVEPRGHYFTAALRATGGYPVGDQIYPSAFVTKEVLRQALDIDFSRKATNIEDIPVSGHEQQGYTGILLAYSRKRAARLGIPRAA